MDDRAPLSHLSGRNRRITERTEAEGPIPVARSRTQAMPSISFLQRHRLRRRREEANSLAESLNTVQEAVDRLNEASNNLSSLLDEPIPRILTPDILASEYSGEAEVNRRRAKRRRLESDNLAPAIKYGYRGQVVPGPLQMNILSCDGGHISGLTAGKVIRNYYWDNLLQNDRSVYCSETSQCNIIYRHSGETPFCLKKVVIKAPVAGFDSPVQEGMMFVSMRSDDLLARTSRYRLRETSPPALPSSHATTEENTFTSTYRGGVHMPLDHGGRGPPSRRAPPPSAQVVINLPQHSSGVTSQPHLNSHAPGNATVQDPQHPIFPLIDLGDDSTPPPRSASPTTAPVFNVEISGDQPSGDEEEETSAGILADLHERYGREFAHVESSSDDDERDDGPTRRRIQSERTAPRKIEWNAADIPATDGSVLKSKVEQLQPHAKFFIDSEKRTVSIKFDPPV
ncbi:hypothetical protein MMC13_005569 [Lambiella insularis]|nr:hypothetical protein [Lambiella insularis]